MSLNAKLRKIKKKKGRTKGREKIRLEKKNIPRAS